MKKLLIYPTSRALRTISGELKKQEGFLPTLMRMDEFEHRAMIVPDRMMVDPIQRIMFLQEAANFKAFNHLKVDRELIRFFTKSDAIFRFFEELAQEGVGFDTLMQADAYAEFDTHLEILEKLLDNYHTMLESKGLTDKVFIPQNYQLNEGFIQGYDQFEIFLEGYLSHYELELIEKIGERKPLIIHYVTSRFNEKMQERFGSYGMVLPKESLVTFDFSKKVILSQETNQAFVYAEVFQVEERYEQIVAAFARIEELVRSGVAPESIVLILPDESFKESFALYDRLHNLNFAMGFDYQKGGAYKKLEALYGYWQHYDQESHSLLERYGLPPEEIKKVDALHRCDSASFFLLLEQLSLLDCIPESAKEYITDQERGNEEVLEKWIHFSKLFKGNIFSRKEWLFLWMKTLSTITIDDTRGGKITVMGVLETRGVQFDAVVIVDFNEGIVPAASGKDQFLNSSVRTFAGLPTKSDRESLQKQYYRRLLEQARYAVIFYCSSENRLPSKFLYELGIEQTDRVAPPLSLLYGEPSQTGKVKDPLVEHFNAGSITWSASKLKTWLECKRKYYYRYIQKIQPKAEEELNEGSFLHLFLDHLFRERDHYDSIKEMQKAIDRLLEELLPKEDAKIAYQKLLWREKLKGFIENQVKHFGAGWRVTAREYEAGGEIGGLRFKGRIDRIDQNDAETLVVDYKSGSIKEANKSKNLERLSDFQMSIYDHLLSKQFPNITLVFMQILEEGRTEEITALEEKNKLLLEHIAELKRTEYFIAEKCEDLQKCKYCEFALMCERGEYL
jgi:RecB family exonuclease